MHANFHSETILRASSRSEYGNEPIFCWGMQLF